MRYITRQTFIALRARRQGHQIASEILNPEIQPSLLPPPTAPKHSPTAPKNSPTPPKNSPTPPKPSYTGDEFADWSELESEDKWGWRLTFWAGILLAIAAATNTYLNWDWLY